MCEHNWVFQSEHDVAKTHGVYTYDFKRIATYYCSKCLESKNKILIEESSDTHPNWYTGKRIW
jgi:hypothetical protein